MSLSTRRSRLMLVMVSLTVVVLAVYGIWSQRPNAPDDSGDTLRRITIAQFGDFFLYAPLYIAVDDGFFRQHGLDVSIVNTGVAANFPIFALAPAAIVWLGIGLGLKVFLAAFATFFVSLQLAHRGARLAVEQFSGVFDGFRATPWDTYTKIIVPGVMDAVLSSMRVSGTGSPELSVANPWRVVSGRTAG